MRIQDVRSKFPQYSDLSDQELADALHGKFYADIPKEKFYSDIGLKVTPATTEKPEISGMEIAKNVGRLAMNLIPQVAATRAVNMANDMIGKGAYSAGGKVTDVAANIGASPETAAGLGFATNVGIQAIPSLIGGSLAKSAAPAVEDSARGLMQSAIKPVLKDLRTGKAERAVQTMLDEGISPTKAGMEALRSKASAIDDAVSAALKGSNASVNKGAVASRISDLVHRIEATNPTPQQARQSVEAVYDQFVGNGLIPKNIPVTQAQAFKQGIYEAIGKSYGEMSSSTVEAQKALARGLKEEISKAVPGVSGMNAKASDLWNALSVAERKVIMQANNNPAGLSLLAKDPAAMIAFMADRSAAFKGLVAQMLYRGSEPGAFAVGAIGGQAVPNLMVPMGQGVSETLFPRNPALQ